MVGQQPPEGEQEQRTHKHGGNVARSTGGSWLHSSFPCWRWQRPKPESCGVARPIHLFPTDGAHPIAACQTLEPTWPRRHASCWGSPQTSRRCPLSQQQQQSDLAPPPWIASSTAVSGERVVGNAAHTHVQATMAILCPCVPSHTRRPTFPNTQTSNRRRLRAQSPASARQSSVGAASQPAASKHYGTRR
jgi:hypothetical protein